MTEQLNRIFRALPIRGGAEPAKMLEVYFDALDGYPAWAIGQAATRFIRGNVDKQSMQFCPRPPELARIVQEELQPVRDEIHMAKKPKRTEYRSTGPAPFEIWVRKRKQMFAGFTVIETGVEWGDFMRGCKGAKYPPGASWDWFSQKVYGVKAQ